MSAAEYAEWMVYYHLEPFGDEVADHRAGTIAAMIANVNRASHIEAYDSLSFIPWRERPGPDLNTRIKAVFSHFH